MTWHPINVAVTQANLLAFAAVGGDGSPDATSPDLARWTVWLRDLQCDPDNRVPLAGQILQHPSEAFAYVADQHQAAAARHIGPPNAVAGHLAQSLATGGGVGDGVGGGVGDGVGGGVGDCVGD